MSPSRDSTAELTRELVLFAASTAAYQLSRFAVSLLVARRVPPAELGVWNALQLVLLYGVVLFLGAPSGMNREVPLLAGRGRREEAARVADAAFWMVLAVAATAGALIATLSLLPAMPAPFRRSLLWLGPLFTAWNLLLYFQMRLRARIDFFTTSLQGFFYAALLPLVALPLVGRAGVPGFIGAQAVAAAATVLFILVAGRLRIAPVIDPAPLGRLVRVGFPIMTAGLLYSLLISVDRWVILGLLGTEALGSYTLAILAVGLLSLLPAILSQQLYPRMAFRFGQTGDPRSLVPLIVRQTTLATAGTLPVVAVAFALLPGLTARFLPDYAAGVAPARILLVGLAILPLGGGMANFLNTTGRQVTYAVLQGLAVALNLILCSALTLATGSLRGAALGVALTFAIYTAALVGVGLRSLGR